ncbi:MAG: N-acetyltransferase family protein [Candidatus Sericytochromatia bacterium]
MIQICKARPEDSEAIWAIFHAVVAKGDTYAFGPETSRADFPGLWLGSQMHTFVAESEGQLLGSFFIKPNQPGLGDHIANAAYMVHPDAQGRGIGKAMCLHSLEEARRLGFKAMQFNLVVSTNTTAVQLWQKLGFAIVGTIPEAFRHRQLGFVAAYVMHRKL